MKNFTFDARLNTTISVKAANLADAEKAANAVLERLTVTDPETKEEYDCDTADGIDLLDED